MIIYALNLLPVTKKNIAMIASASQVCGRISIKVCTVFIFFIKHSVYKRVNKMLTLYYSPIISIIAFWNFSVFREASFASVPLIEK